MRLQRHHCLFSVIPDSKIPLTFCWGIQDDTDFLVDLQKDVIPSALYIDIKVFGLKYCDIRFSPYCPAKLQIIIILYIFPDYYYYYQDTYSLLRTFACRSTEITSVWSRGQVDQSQAVIFSFSHNPHNTALSRTHGSHNDNNLVQFHRTQRVIPTQFNYSATLWPSEGGRKKNGKVVIGLFGMWFQR